MLIGITGRASSGKSTVANLLVRNHGFAEVGLADPLKRICREVFLFTDIQLWGPSSERDKPDTRYDGLTPRRALQTLGSEWGRALYENVWVDNALRVVDQLLFHLKDGRSHYYDKHRHYNYNLRVGLFARAGNDDEASHGERIEGVVIPDIRFLNEVDAIRREGGVIWKTTHGHGLTGVAAQHESERHIDNIAADFSFSPNTPLDELPGVVEKFLTWSKKKARK